MSTPIFETGPDRLLAGLLAGGLDSGESGLYRHFKGGLYRVLGTLPYRDDDTRAVVYLGADEKLNVRSFDNFFDTLPDGRARFAPAEEGS